MKQPVYQTVNLHVRGTGTLTISVDAVVARGLLHSFQKGSLPEKLTSENVQCSPDTSAFAVLTADISAITTTPPSPVQGSKSLLSGNVTWPPK